GEASARLPLAPPRGACVRGAGSVVLLCSSLKIMPQVMGFSEASRKIRLFRQGRQSFRAPTQLGGAPQSFGMPSRGAAQGAGCRIRDGSRDSSKGAAGRRRAVRGRGPVLTRGLRIPRASV